MNQDVPKTALSLAPKDLTLYCEASTSDEPAVCRDIREASLQHPKSHWICGPLVGSFLQTLVLATRAKRVLDIGTFTGYSAAYMASASPDVIITSIEVDPNFAANANATFAKNGLASQISVECACAFNWLSEHSDALFDLIFFDSNRAQLMRLAPLFRRSLITGGVLVMDNACLRGKVLAPTRPWDHETIAFNANIQRDPHFLTTLLPIRDGLLVAYKLS